ncbi:hypothetical protein J6O48_08420 [bacterium]|nr:hypothetical protein [bacterium]
MTHEIRFVIDWGKVRQECISHNWYTRGNNAEYENMLFTLCKGNTLEDVYRVARDIYEHSDKERIDNYFAESDKEPVKCIMDYIINECCYILIE